MSRAASSSRRCLLSMVQKHYSTSSPASLFPQYIPHSLSQIKYHPHGIIGTSQFKISYSMDRNIHQMEQNGQNNRIGLATKRQQGASPRGEASLSPISPWHHIPYKLHPDSRNLDYGANENHQQRSSSSSKTSQLYTFINEIPNGTFRKIECATKQFMNPLVQDKQKKTGALRELRYSKYGIPFNYGMISQTWENPSKVSEPLKQSDGGRFAKCLGDGDPIDVCEITVTEPSNMINQGEVASVKILGCLALIDENEIDWKLIAVAEQFADQYRDLKDVDERMLKAIKDWFQKYKTVDGKPENEFALNGEYMDASFAIDVLEEGHTEWRELVEQHWRDGYNDHRMWIPEQEN